jgi:hypothetical protein
MNLALKIVAVCERETIGKDGRSRRVKAKGNNYGEEARHWKEKPHNFVKSFLSFGRSYFR